MQLNTSLFTQLNEKLFYKVICYCYLHVFVAFLLIVFKIKCGCKNQCLTTRPGLYGLLQVTVFHPGDRGRGVAVSDCPPSPLSACKTFTFQSLPGKYFKKYQYAARCVMFNMCGALAIIKFIHDCYV